MSANAIKFLFWQMLNHMTNNVIYQASRLGRHIPLLLFCVFSLVFTSACSSLAVPALVRPNFETDTSKLREGNYSLDPAHSFLLFKVGHLGLATYVGRFNRFEASLDFDPDDVTQSKLEGLVFLESIDANNEEVESLLQERQWFNTGEHPTAKFSSTAVTVASADDGKSTLAVAGELTFRGVTLPLQLEAQFNGGADNLLTRKYTIGFSASGEFSRAAFGMGEFPGLVGDTVTLEFYAEFQRQ